MKPDDYMKVQMTLLKAGKEISQLDLESFCDAISRAETLGPIVDPTLSRRAMDRLEKIKKVAQTARAFKHAFAELYDVIFKESFAEWEAKQNTTDNP